MKEFHEEYQCVFAKSFHLDYNEKQNFSHEPPMAESVAERRCKAQHMIMKFVIEYITGTQGRKIKKLKAPPD